MKQWKIFGACLSIFLVAYYLPLSMVTVQGAILEAFRMLQWYARNHTLACVVPALSLPSILVIRTIVGNKKTAVFTGLVVIMATVAGMIYGGFIQGGMT